MDTIFDTHSSNPIELYNNEGIKIKLSPYTASVSIISVQNSSPNIKVSIINDTMKNTDSPLPQKEGDDVVQYPIHYTDNYTIKLVRGTPFHGIIVYDTKTITLTANRSWTIEG